MSFYIRSKLNRPQTTSNHNRPLDNSAIKDSRLVKQYTTPKMGREKENLYDENIKLKSQLNEQTQQLLYARSKIQQLERELQRFENLIEDSIKPETSQQKVQIERYGLIMKMKTKQKQLILELQNKTKELIELKKTMRFTNYQELEIELKNYIDETLRLRQKLEYNEQMIAIQSSAEPLEKQILHLEKTIKVLQRDNIELNSKQLNNDVITSKLQIQLEESLKQNEKQLNEIIHYEQMVKELNEYNRQCNDLISQLQIQNKVWVQSQQNTTSEELFKIQSQLESLQNKYSQEMDMKNQEIRSLKIEVQRLNLHIQEMEKIIENQEDKIREIECSVYSPVSRVGNIESPLQNGFKIMQIEMKSQVMKKKLPRVQFTDIREICMRVRLNLVKHKVEYQDIEKYFNDSEELSIHQVKNILHKSPFEIHDHQQIKLLSRYLVEDNSEDYLIYDQDRTNQTTIIKSVMKKIVGKYEILDNEEEQSILQSIQQKLNPSLIETIQMMLTKKKNLQPGTCEQSDLDQALKFHEIQFTHKEQERFNLICFEVSNSLEIINYERLLTYFK
ncbi:unnamed protein product [Paramecium pentaurelia]|uniref:Uncharacterized protein n=1 Tax=Paramecium pentaurelia TaxID=43138 RepID=A0A8S1TJQ1_9CILI|nr:unnamed protein product [Paramecium pentaurelia]